MLPGTQVWSRSRAKALFDEEQQFIAPGLQTIALLSELAIERGRGATLIDVDGNVYLDLNAGVSVASLGHAHPGYVAALTAQLGRVSVGSFTSRPRAALVRLIADLSPGALKRVQFFSGGAEAVEAAIRLARSYTTRTDIIGFTGAFHGKTAGVLPLSDVAWKEAVGPLPAGYHLAPFPDPTRFAGSAQDCLAASIDGLRHVVLEHAGGRPAAIIVEPIQGTAGNIVPPPGFMRRVLEVARESGALLIADEMITGFGRTGLMFGCTHDDVTPDIMTMGKGMASGFPVSAVLSTDAIVAAEPFSLPSASSSSYGGNPLASAAALVTIRTILDDNLVENSARVGRVLLDGLVELAKRHPSIANVRGQGLLIGFDLVTRGDPSAPDLKVGPTTGPAVGPISAGPTVVGPTFRSGATESAVVGPTFRSGVTESALVGPTFRSGVTESARVGPSLSSGLSLMPKNGCVAFFNECLANGLILMGYTPRVRIHPPLILSTDEATRALAIIGHALDRIERC
jgi:4-aminobutyrate aminotransferase-like enzyme